MQEVICRLAGVVVAHQEGEGGPDCVEHRLDVPAHIDQQEAARNPAAAEPLSKQVPCVYDCYCSGEDMQENEPALESHGDTSLRRMDFPLGRIQVLQAKLHVC